MDFARAFTTAFCSVFLLTALAFAVTPTTVISMTPVSGEDTTGDTTYVLSPTDLGKLAVNDGVQGQADALHRYAIQGYWPTSYYENKYLEVLFCSCQECQDSVPLCSQITGADITVDWSKFCNITSARIRVWDESSQSWVDNSIPVPTSNYNDITSSVDIFSFINTPSDANSLKARFQAAWLLDNTGAKTFHDLIKADIEYSINPCGSYSTDETCTAYNSDERCPDCQWCSECNDNHQSTTARCINDNVNCGYQCVKDSCGAECASDSDCPVAECIGNTRYILDDCDTEEGCVCEYEEKGEDCDAYDGTYRTTETRTVDFDQCNTIEQRKFETRDYYCTIGGCEYDVTSVEWRDIEGTKEPKADETPCEDGYYCTVDDMCSNGECHSGSPRDCSDGNECTTDSCNDDTNMCVNAPKDQGTECGFPRDCPESEICEKDYQFGDPLSPFELYFPADGHDTCDGSGHCIEYSCQSTGKECEEDCGAACEENDDCVVTNTCTCDNIYQTRTGTCDTEETCSCNYGPWVDGTCLQSYENCHAECYDNTQCTGGLIGNYCNYDGECLCSCSCGYTQIYCPEAGEHDGVCYYGERGCDDEGCTLTQKQMCYEDECDPETGPHDTVGPVVSDLQIERQCKDFTITGTATDGCSNVAGAEFYIDSCPEGDGEPMSASDGSFDSSEEDVEGQFNAATFAEGNFDSGIFTLYVNAQDSSENWGSCATKEFCVDSTDPDIEKTYGSPFYSDDENDYIKSTTEITLTATDDPTCVDSGISATYYRYCKISEEEDEMVESIMQVEGCEYVCDGDWVAYESPFKIEDGEGLYQIEFKTIDNYCNEECGTQTVVVDDSPPETEKDGNWCTCTSDGCNYDHLIFDDNVFTLSAEDEPDDFHSGVDSVTYRYCTYNPETDGDDEEEECGEECMNDCSYECQGDWHNISGDETSFSITGPDGLYYVEYYSTDNLGNKEQKKCEVDLMNNTIFSGFSSSIPSHTQIDDFTVDVTDMAPCLENAVCSYRIFNGSVCGDWTTWEERECNAPLLVDVGGCCDETDGDCRCGVKDITVETKIEACQGHSATGSKTYHIDFVNPPATLVGTSGTYAGPDVEILIDTNKPSECRFDTSDKWFDDMAYEMETDDNFHHSYLLEGLADGEYTYYYRCQDLLGNAMPWALPIMFMVDSEQDMVASPSGGSPVFYGFSYSGGGSVTTTTAKTTTTFQAPAPSTTTTIRQEVAEVQAAAENEPYVPPYGTVLQGPTSPITGFVTSVTKDPAPILGVITAIIAIALLLIL